MRIHFVLAVSVNRFERFDISGNPFKLLGLKLSYIFMTTLPTKVLQINHQVKMIWEVTKAYY